MLENRVKKLLSEGKAAWGSALPDASEMMAKATLDQGVDFQWIPIICRLKRRDALLRVPSLEPGSIKKGLDMGCSCIMVPQVDNAEQARLAVEFCKYPGALPCSAGMNGNRGVGPLWPYLLDVDLQDYLESANQETCVIVQAETREGLANLERIAEVDGVDVVFAGPADISAALGHLGDMRHPEVQKCLENFPERVAKCGKASGITFTDVEDCRKAFQQGYRLINVSNLSHFGQVAMAGALASLRETEKAGNK